LKWMVRIDMEGLTGIVSMEQVVPGASEYTFGQRMLMHDLEALLDGLLQKDDDEVVLYDIHFYGRNTVFDRLDPRVTVICGKPNYTPANQAYLDGAFDGMLLLGLHAKSETPNALLAHNYEHDIRRMSVNGVSVGEIGMEALMAGEANVPLVMVTADSEGVRETEALLPGTLTVSVKQSLGETSAMCYSPVVTRKSIREAALRCAAHCRSLRPFVIKGPVQLEMSFRPGAVLERITPHLKAWQTSEDRFLIAGDSVTEVWEQYLIAKK
jgi:D-amino peptidase